ncbi:orotidine-5'-phosphate decarboxylase [soil metagenome]
MTLSSSPATTISDPLCVALDSADPDECRRLATATQDHVGVFKVGLTAFAAGGGGLVSELARRRPVFCDLKLHDIPAQVAGTVGVVASLGASFVTVHAAGGAAMVQGAVAAAGEDLVVLGVTVLTSIDEGSLDALGTSGGVRNQVLRLAELALEAGAPGLVCSPLEVEAVRSRFGGRAQGGPILVVPGIRPTGSPGDDQRRVATPADALEAGADILVIGRPITSAPDPGAAARRVSEGLASPAEP